MTQSIERVDHTIPKEEAVFAFGPEMRPVLEIDPGEVVTFETHDCFSGQIQTENDLVTDIDFSKVNPACHRPCVRPGRRTRRQPRGRDPGHQAWPSRGRDHHPGLWPAHRSG